MNRIRIVLLDMPPLLLEILRDMIAPQPDMEIVGAATNEEQLDQLLERTDADVIVVRQDNALKRDRHHDVLYQRPRLRILEIADEGRSGVLHEMRPRRIALGELSLQRVLEAIRGGGGQRGTTIHA